MNITIDDVKIEHWNQFQYLEVINCIAKELKINDRIEKAFKMYYVMNNSFVNRRVQINKDEGIQGNI